MAQRAAELAERFERAVDDCARTVEALSEEQWRRRCPDERCSVAALARHIAGAIPWEMRAFQQIAAGEQPTALTWDKLAEINAAGARALDAFPRAEALALLRANAAAAADDVRAFTPAQLRRSGRYIAELPAWTLDEWLERVLIGHVTGHLQSIRAAVAPDRV